MKAVSSSIFFLAVLSGCYNPPEFSSVPRIEYASIEKFPEIDPISGGKTDKVVVTITFEDGDGDLGASAAELSDDAFKDRYGDSGSYELITVRKLPNGSLDERIYLEDKFKWIPILKTDGTKGAIKGKLDMNVFRRYGNSSVMVEEKYKIRIRDRALQYSNQVETDFISVPAYQ
jgi:hypothetical protein